MNLGDWRIIIALGEIVSALLFLFPKTNRYGRLLLSSYIGGAFVAHMTNNVSIVVPSILLIVIWIGIYLREPDFFKLQ